MERILVTGGIGRVGMVTVQRLLNSGYAVRVVDRRAPDELPAEAQPLLEQIEYGMVDINDLDALRRQMDGCQKVVHLAAIPAPALAPPQTVFHINTGGTFNVFQAATDLGIRRVVQASSINAVGLFYGVRTTDPLYFPIDEEHPHLGTDAYSFSKWVVEQTAEYFWRREGISSVSLRFPAVITSQMRLVWMQRGQAGSSFIDRMLALPIAERRQTINALLAQIDAIRTQRKMEDQQFYQRLFFHDSDVSPDLRWLFASRNNFFTLIDGRDAAQAIEKGLTAEYDGAHALFVNEAQNATGYDSELLLDLFFPEVTARKRPIPGEDSLVSIEKARRLIGFEPEFGEE